MPEGLLSSVSAGASPEPVQQKGTHWRGQHHCRACGNLFCASCSSKKKELPEFGYLGEQRVCNTCFSSASSDNPKKKRGRSSTVSRPVLEDTMLLTDSLGRPVRRFHFCLTVNSFRWYKNQGEEESGRLHRYT